jgi:two-component system sensor histidine kinase ChvG
MPMRVSIANRIRTVYRALAMKIVFLAFVFLLIPVILYHLFESADAQQSRLLQRTVEEKGTLIASVLQPRLAGFQG